MRALTHAVNAYQSSEQIVLTDNGACGSGSGSYLIYWVERTACPRACCEHLPEQRADCVCLDSQHYNWQQNGQQVTDKST